MTPELNDDYRDMLAALGRAGVEFVVVGAHALAAHGLVRATGDIDILIRPNPSNAARVMAAMRDFGAPIQAHGVTVEDFTVEDNVYQIGVAPNRIDLLTSITGVTFDDAWASRVGVHVAGMDFFVLGRGALIANKRALGRPKDLVDALALEAAEPR